MFKLLFMARDKFPPFRVDITVLFARELRKRGYEIDWIFQARKGASKSFTARWGGGTAYVGATRDADNIISKAIKNLLCWANDFRIFNILKKRHYDVVVVRDKIFGALPAMVAARLHGSKFVLWLSYPFVENDLYQVHKHIAPFPLLYLARGMLGQFVLYRLLFPFADHVFVQTKYMKEKIAAKYNVPADSMTPVPMGVSLESLPKQAEKKQGFTTNMGTKDIVYLGTLMKTRRLDFLIRAFGKVKEKCKDARLILVGSWVDPSDEEFLMNEIEKLNLSDSVIITGQLEQKKAWEIVRRADVCVSPICPSPILDCGSPTKMIEYMALGKAVVANDHPEQKEILEDCKAGLCVAWDEKEFAEAMIFLLKNPEEAAKMGTTGCKYIFSKRNYESLAGIVNAKLLEIID